jgi:serine protease AprX
VRLARPLAAAAVLPAALLALPSQAAPAAPAGPLGKYVVALDGDLTAEVGEALTDAGVVRGLELPTIDAVAVTAPTAVAPLLAELPGVRAVVPQRRIVLHLHRSKEQIDALGVAEAERYTNAKGTFERPGVTGEGVKVGIIDSGIFSQHPGFEDRVTRGLNFEFSELMDSGIVPASQWDTYAETTGPTALQDEVGHGTHVAGTVGGSGAGAQSDRDLAGVAPDVEIVALKIASAANGVVEDVGFEENALAAIDYLVRNRDSGVKLTNNSWGLLETEPSNVPGEATDFDAANAVVEAASAAGITMVFSAGNDGPEPGSINEDPGGAPSAITVAAACKGVDEDQGGSCPAGEITGFSSRGAADGTGPQVDVAAPGDQILAPVSPNAVLTPLTECLDPSEPLYFCISGTSMAAPHVAGVVALMQQVNPALLPAQAERCLTTTANDMLAPGRDIDSGFGMVDTRSALQCAYDLTGPTAVGQSAPARPVAGPPAAAPSAPSTGSLPATGAPVALGAVALLALAGAALLRRRA